MPGDSYKRWFNPSPMSHGPLPISWRILQVSLFNILCPWYVPSRADTLTWSIRCRYADLRNSANVSKFRKQYHSSSISAMFIESVNKHWFRFKKINLLQFCNFTKFECLKWYQTYIDLYSHCILLTYARFRVLRKFLYQVFYKNIYAGIFLW